MTQPDYDVWLDRARKELSPEAGDQARVFTALEQRLSLPSNDAGDHDRVDHDLHSTPPPAIEPAPSAATGVSGTLVRWAFGVLVPLAGVVGVALFLTTHSAAPTSSARSKQPAIVAQASSPEAIEQVAEVEVKAEPPAPDVPALRERMNDKKPARKKCRTAQGKERPCSTSVRSSETALAIASPEPLDTPPSAAPPAAAKPVASLSDELSALREAQRALRAGQAEWALDVLSNFEREAPGPGAMLEERSAAATMARCVLALRGETANGSARELYDGFLRRHPHSAYAARLQRTCLPKP